MTGTPYRPDLRIRFTENGKYLYMSPANNGMTMEEIAVACLGSGASFSIVNAEDVPPIPETPNSYIIAKTTPWLRMTQEEARIMDGIMTETDAQMRQVYMAAQYLSSGDPFWQTLHQLIAENLPGGSTRADELLAPEG